jgi:hypothetical protein
VTTYRVLKARNAEFQHGVATEVFCVIDPAWTPERSYVQAQELGERFGAGKFILLPERDRFIAWEEYEVVETTPQFDFAKSEEEVAV